MITIAFSDWLDPVLSPLLGLPSLWAIVIVSFLISLIITIVYKYTTNQAEMKRLKNEMKANQKKMREHKKDPQKVMALQKEVMQTNMTYMKHSLKSTLYSFLPIILIFSWMTANFAYVPIMPGDEFETQIRLEPDVVGSVSINSPPRIEVLNGAAQQIADSQATWKLKGESGEFLLQFTRNGVTYDKVVLIDEKRYENPFKEVNDGVVKSIEVLHQKNIVLNFLGWEMGWLISYILFAVVFSIVIRKVIKVY